MNRLNILIISFVAVLSLLVYFTITKDILSSIGFGMLFGIPSALILERGLTQNNSLEGEK